MGEDCSVAGFGDDTLCLIVCLEEELKDVARKWNR